MAGSKISLLNAESRADIDRWIAKYPVERKQSAVMAALRIAQDQNGGWLTTDLMDAVADYLEMPAIAVYEVASFYSMYELEPVGRHKICVCTNISHRRLLRAPPPFALDLALEPKVIGPGINEANITHLIGRLRLRRINRQDNHVRHAREIEQEESWNRAGAGDQTHLWN